MNYTATTKEAYQLLHQGTLALSQMQCNGIHIDTKYLEQAIEKTTAKIHELSKQLKEKDVFKVWKRIYGSKANPGSRTQLGVVLKEIGVETSGITATGRSKTDEEALEKINIPFVKDYVQLEKLKKSKSTYLQGIQEELLGEFIYPSWNLHTVRSLRSSCADPNFQNFPIRDKKQGELVRRCIIPRKGRRLIEIDLVGNEVKVSCCYNKDPKLIEYIKDPTKDMHRDSAARLYMLDKNQVTKEIRYYAKNKFVFPEFYGSVYFQCAPHLWDALDLPTTDGTLLRTHLAKKGMTELGRCDSKQEPRLGTYEYFVKEVERKFWYQDFPVYTQWKEQWFSDYNKRGGFSLLTGFWIEGILERNQVLNFPVQGSAFHIILLFIIKMTKWLKRNRMKSLLIGQIHDSAESDNPESEIQDYLHKAKEIICEEIPKEWPWIIVPLDIEVMVTPIDGSWHDKKEWVEKDGKWQEK